MFVESELNFSRSFESVHTVLDNGDLFKTDAGIEGIRDDRAQVKEADVITKHRKEKNISEVDSFFDGVVLSGMSVKDEEVEVFLSERLLEGRSDHQRREQLLREAESSCEVQLFVQIDGEDVQVLLGGDFSEDESDGGLADPALEVPESNC